MGHYRFGLPRAPAELFSLGFEANVPTWYSSALLLVAGLLLGRIADRDGTRHRRRWWLLAGIFVYMSLDEAIEIHEYLVYLVPLETTGVLFFAWVIPASAILLLLAAIYWPFLRDLPAGSRRRFVVAGAIFVGGALLMELPAGWWVERHGYDNLTYGLIDWVEEAMEMSGSTLFVIALRRHEREAT